MKYEHISILALCDAIKTSIDAGMNQPDLVLLFCSFVPQSSSVYSPNKALKKRKATIATCSYFNTADVWTTANKQSLQMVQVQLPVPAGNKLTTFWVSYTLTGKKKPTAVLHVMISGCPKCPQYIQYKEHVLHVTPTHSWRGSFYFQTSCYQEVRADAWLSGLMVHF